MKLVVGKWLVDPSENKVIHTVTDQTVKLEPRAMEVLHYFTQKPNQVISRDELIEHVWGGRIVGDHAIYRVINQIRKALDPNNKDAYLTTIAKKGYKLIHEVEPYIEKLSDSRPLAKTNNINSESRVTSSQSAPNGVKNIALLGFIAISLFALWKIVLEQKWDYYQTPVYTDIKPLNSENAFEDYPRYSANGKYIVYSKKDAAESNFNLYIKEINTSSSQQITNDDIDWIRPVISNDANVIIAIGNNENACSVYVIRKNDANTYKPKELFSCEQNTFIDIALNSIGDKFYFTYKDSQNPVSRIFSYKVKTGKREQISNAFDSQYGDHTIALSPDDKQLAFIRGTDDGESLIGLYNVSKKSIKILTVLDKWLNSLSWSKNGADLVYQEGPKIYKHSVKHNYSKPLISSPTRLIRSVHSPVNSKLSIVKRESQFSVWNMPNPFYEESESKGAENFKQIMFSDTMEYYPHFANSSDDIAFVSKRSGSQQVWMRDKLGEYKQLTYFDDSRLIHHLSWSPDDKYLVSNTISDGFIYLINTKSGESENIISQEEYPYATNPTWSLDGKSIYFSAEIEGDLNAFKYDIELKSITQVTEGGVGWYKEIAANKFVYVKSNEPGLRTMVDGIERTLIININLAESALIDVNDIAKELYFISVKEEKLYRLNLNNWQVTKKTIPVLPSLTSSLSISRDGRNIVFADIFRRKSKIYNVSP